MQKYEMGEEDDEEEEIEEKIRVGPDTKADKEM